MSVKLVIPQYSVKYFGNRTITIIFMKIVEYRAYKQAAKWTYGMLG